MVMMGKGSDVTGLADLNIANQLCLLMCGGHRAVSKVRSTIDNLLDRTVRLSSGSLVKVIFFCLSGLKQLEAARRSHF